MTQTDTVIQEISQSLKRKNLEIGYEISFPRYAIIPDEVRLALKVLENNGMKITISINEVIQKK